MSAIDKVFARSEVAMLNAGHSDWVLVLSGACRGIRFRCRMDVETVLDHESPTGPDPREQDVMRILPPSSGVRVPDLSGLESQDLVQVEGSGVKWRVVQREANPGSITTDYWVEKQI